MNIIQSTTTDKKAVYQMTKGANVARVQDHEGETITVADFVLYEDVKSDGTSMLILSMKDSNTGNIIATNSPTFKEAFLDIAAICGEPADMIGENIRIDSGTSKAGRKYLTCVWA